jgi:cell division protein FtsA
MASTESLYTAIDVGTTKVCTLVAKVSPSGEMQVVALGRAESSGMKKGMVVGPQELQAAVRLSVAEAVSMLGKSLPSAYVGITGSHLRCMNTTASTTRKTQGGAPVTEGDVDRLLESALPQSVHRRRVVHVVPRRYKLDGLDGIRNPVGLSGRHMDVESHVVIGDSSSLENVARVVQAAGVRVKGLVMEHLASSEAVLSTDEQERGVVLVDIGGGTSDVALFRDGAIQHTAAVPVAGHQFTSDVAIGMGISLSLAEQAKVMHGSVLTDGVGPKEMVEVRASDETKTIAQLPLNTLLRDRAVELVRLIMLTVRESGLDRMPPAGLVLTGGSANMAGLAAVAAEYASCPVRIGTPSAVLGLPPELEDASFATSVGLLMWGIQHRRPNPVSPRITLSAPVFHRLREWIARVSFKRPREVQA